MPALLAVLLLLLLLATSAETAKKAKRKSKAGGSAQDRPLRLPPSSRVGAAAYGVPERSSWTTAAELPPLAARNATTWPPLPHAEVNVNDAMHRHLKRDGHYHLQGLLSPAELASYRPHIVAAALAIAARCETDCDSKDDPLDEKCRGCERVSTTPSAMPKSFVKARNLHRVSKAVRKLVTSPRLASVGTQCHASNPAFPESVLIDCV